ncbi:MAG: hypothetical protein DRM99_03495 [Thermoplasmata archaeon]|nr:MAG: hypothetical protein DRM99_03495 [Thermoplasmata archaeon]
MLYFGSYYYVFDILNRAYQKNYKLIKTIKIEMEKGELKHPVMRKKLTFGQKAADKLTAFAGSWLFIILLFIFIAMWMCVNVWAYIHHWDPYPFILLNFILSCLAAIQAPIILMSQNREAERDRIRARYDYLVNRKAEREVEDIQQDLEKIKRMIRSLKR